MSFADLLDESIRIWRQRWVNYALISAIGFLPPGLVLVWVGEQMSLLQRSLISDLPTGRFASPQAFAQIGQLAGGFGIYFVIALVFQGLWTLAVIAATDGYLRGVEASVGNVYGLALRRFGVLVLSGLVFFGAFIVLVIPTVLLLVPTIGGLLGIPVAVICLLLWWLAPGTRVQGLKWAIILATPMGLLLYVGWRWALAAPAIVLERRGPIEALRRSWQLTQDHWFRVFGVLAVVTIVVGILESVLVGIVQVPITVGAVSRGEIGLGPAETAIVYGMQTIFRVLFSGIVGAVFGVLFNDLRNRREGTDIAERLQELEAAPLSANA